MNRWADYIEFRCLYVDDHIITKDDVLDLFFDEDILDLQRGQSVHSANYDKLSTNIDNYYEVIKYRNEMFSEYYPFEIEDGQCITIKETLIGEYLHYFFLLICSNISFMDKLSMQKVTYAFEKYCYPFMKCLMPVNAQTELFGTARDEGVFHGNLRTRIMQLAECLGAQTTKIIDQDERYDRIRGGDGGLDIVSFLKLDDSSHIPFAFAQCTCSYDEWIDKQKAVGYDVWSTRIAPLAPFWSCMFVPFFCQNASGRFENATEIHTCVIDRKRILNLLNSNHKLFCETELKELKELLKKIW